MIAQLNLLKTYLKMYPMLDLGLLINFLVVAGSKAGSRKKVAIKGSVESWKIRFSISINKFKTVRTLIYLCYHLDL